MSDNCIRVTGYYMLKRPGVYPWPHPSNSKRTIMLLETDVLLKASDGTYQAVSGVVCSGLRIPEENLIYYVGGTTITLSGEIL